MRERALVPQLWLKPLTPNPNPSPGPLTLTLTPNPNPNPYPYPYQVQQLWFNSMLVDEHNHTGMGGYLDGKPTNWMQVQQELGGAVGVAVAVVAVPSNWMQAR